MPFLPPNQQRQSTEGMNRMNPQKIRKGSEFRWGSLSSGCHEPTATPFSRPSPLLSVPSHLRRSPHVRITGGGGRNRSGRQTNENLYVHIASTFVNAKRTRTHVEKCTYCGQMTLRKISKLDATRFHTLRLKCTRFDFRWGLRQCSPKSPSCI